MPHVVYLHSALTQRRIVPGNEQEARRVFRFEQIDIWIAMGLAGLVNGAMLLMAAAVFVLHGLVNVATLEDAYALMRAERGELPRATNVISGPSRTGDIEQTIVLGAHGPYRVHVIVVTAA